MAVPPPSYQAIAGTPIEKIDFPPRALSSDGLFSSAEYERFDVLIDRANKWLRTNPHSVVMHVEGIETKAVSGQRRADTESTVFIENGKRNITYTRSLRLWVRSCGGAVSQIPQQIGYFNVMPACHKDRGWLRKPEFEPFNATIHKINQHFTRHPIQGRILTLETEEIKISNWTGSVDADKTHWTTRVDRGIYYVMVIRIFYELGPPAMEEIGFADFVPKIHQSPGMLSHGRADDLAVIAQQAHRWIQNQNGIKVTNVQTIDYKVTRRLFEDTRIDTMRSCYFQAGSGSTSFMRIMRVCYTRSLSGELPPPLPILSYKTFKPHCLSRGGMFSLPEFTNQSSAVDIANAWIKATGAKVISAETVTVRYRTGGQYGEPEVTLTSKDEDKDEVMLFVIRVFLDGVYRDPPRSVLPRVPANARAATSADDCMCCTVM